MSLLLPVGLGLAALVLLSRPQTASAAGAPAPPPPAQPPPFTQLPWLAQLGVPVITNPALEPPCSTARDRRPLLPEFATPKDRTWIANHLPGRGGPPVVIAQPGQPPILSWCERPDKTGGGGVLKQLGLGNLAGSLLSSVTGGLAAPVTALAGTAVNQLTNVFRDEQDHPSCDCGCGQCKGH